VLRIAGFGYTLAKQSSAAATLDNRLSFSFSNFGVLVSGTRITLSGLAGTLETSEDSDSRILIEEPSVSGTLVAAPVSSAGPFTVDVDLGDTSLGYLFKLGSDLRKITGWDTQSRLVFVESAFPGSVPYSGQAFSVTIDFHTSFGHVGAWNISTGTLTMTVGANTVAGKLYGFSFLVKNPRLQRPAADVYIESQGPESNSPRWLMVNAPLREAPLFIIGMATKIIAQSTPSPGAVNTITVTFGSSESIGSQYGSTVVISGLTGSTTNTPTLNLTLVSGHDIQNTISPVADWHRQQGKLTIYLPGTTLPQENYTIQFNLQNPRDRQESPDVSIEVVPLPRIYPSLMMKGEGNHQPMLIGGHIYSPKIGQSTSRASNWALGGSDVTNTISVTFATNHWLTTAPKYGGSAATPNCTFTISGILPNTWGSGTLNKYVTHGFAQTTSSTTFTLDPRASSIDDAYYGYGIQIRFEVRWIVAYMGISRIASVSTPFSFVPIEFVDRYILLPPDSETIPLASPNAGTFEAFGEYHLFGGTFKGVLSGETVPYSDFVFSFDVTNPVQGRLGADRLRFQLCDLFEVDMTPAEFTSHPGNVGGHAFPPVMYQDNPGSLAVNKFTIQLNPYSTLEPGDIVTIVGLDGINLVDAINGSMPGEFTLRDDSVQYPGACPIYTQECQRSRTMSDYVGCDVQYCECPEPEYSCGAYFWSGVGSVPPPTDLTGSGWWDGSRLTLQVVTRTASSTPERRQGQISFSFQAQNPETSRSSPKIEIEVNGANNVFPRQDILKGLQHLENLIPPYKPLTTVYNTAPLLIAGFIKKVIYQRTPSSNTSNTVTVVVQSFIDLTYEQNGFVKIKGFAIPGLNPPPYFRDVPIEYLHDINVCERSSDLELECDVDLAQDEVFGYAFAFSLLRPAFSFALMCIHARTDVYGMC
jgi:hypothetical protein